MAKTVGHSKLPWIIRQEDNSNFYIIDAEDTPIAMIEFAKPALTEEGLDKEQGRAEAIICAVNNHERLLEALKEMTVQAMGVLNRMSAPQLDTACRNAIATIKAIEKGE